MLELYKNIKERRLKLNLTQTDLALRTGYSDKSMISKIERGEVDLSQSKIMVFAEALQTTPGALMGDDGILPPYDGIATVGTRKFPVLGNVSCGEPIFMAEEKELYIEVGTDIKADFILYAKGDSMINARINDGDIVFIREQPMVNDGEIAAVAIEDECTLKRFYYDRAHQTVTLVAENPKYAPMVFYGERLNQIRVIGKAVAFQSDVR